MADRPTSAAKSVEGLHHKESALDRARALRDRFTHAQEQNNEKQKPREAEKPGGYREVRLSDGQFPRRSARMTHLCSLKSTHTKNRICPRLPAGKKGQATPPCFSIDRKSTRLNSSHR